MAQSVRSLSAWVALYLLTLGMASAASLTMPLPLATRSAIMLVPILPALGIVAWQVRIFRQMDEMQVRNQLLAIAWAFAATALFVISYALLEVAGWPRLPMFVLWLVMLSFWVLCSWTQRLRFR